VLVPHGETVFHHGERSIVFVADEATAELHEYVANLPSIAS
jgi:hypothetical protein